jgi:hypothetical protein
MRNFRVEFHKGINVVGDKTVIPPGFVTIEDNVDLRSGMPRAIKAPEYHSEITVPGGTNRIYCYRNKWYFSPLWRDYVSVFLNGHERVHFTQDGGLPQKIVDGIQVNLGTPAPKVAPIVKAASQMVPTITLVQGLGGNLKANTTRSYRVSVETTSGIMPASAPISIVANVDNTQVTVTWNFIAGAVKYHLYAGNGSDEKEIAVFGSGTLTFTDSGGGYGYGRPASDYDSLNPYTYFYTFIREVSTVQDESGPSQLSDSISSSTGRLLTFDPQGDGFLTQSNVQTISTGISLTKSATYAPPVVITSAAYSIMLNQVAFGTQTPHGFSNGDIVVFQGFSDPNWNNKQYTIVIDQSNTSMFYVQNMVSPKDTISGTSFLAQPAKTKVTLASTPTYPVTTGTVVYGSVTDASASSQPAFYTATRIDDSRFWIPVYTSSASPSMASFQYVPNNGYIKYRNIYRTGDASGYNLVAQIPIGQLTFFDTVAASSLGDTPDSFYSENGVDVIFNVPPPGMTGLVEHYGMLFGIDGYKVRWTPTNRPDAWPDYAFFAFAYQPVALASFAGALMVVTEDGVYRIDGNVPTALSLNKTKAENGCIARHSVRKTHAGLVYLAQRGLMLFDGMNAECLTDARLPYSFFLGSLPLPTAIPHYWYPTLNSYNYQTLGSSDGVLGSANSSQSGSTYASGGLIDAIRSFYHDGKYYLFWGGADPNYQGNTALCVDLQMSGYPITTVGMKAIDVHVDDYSVPWCLFNYSVTAGAPPSNMDVFIGAQSSMNSSPSWGTASGLGLFTFGSSKTGSIPFYIRTGQNACGDPTERKRFNNIQIHSDGSRGGTIGARVWIDGRYVCDGRLTPTETPDKRRKLNIPKNQNTGYVIDVEIAGDIPTRAIEYNFDGMPKEG